jgi:outer membrane protein OmpA-like peptidoglycan-associated protein
MLSGGLKSMDDLAGFLKEYPNRNIMIEGFTDNIGSEAFNLELSKNRANAVKAELINRMIAENRINTTGYGFQFPVANNSTESGRQQNRRVEIVISDQDGNISPRRQ